MKKISIITVCYNEYNVERTLKSVCNQKFTEFEWIVIDGGSTQSILDILNKYKDKMNYFISEPDKGIYNAMNKGLSIATGEYINFLNAGDFYTDDNVLEKISKHLNKDIIYGNLNTFTNLEKFNTHIYPKKLTIDFLVESSLPHPSSFIKRDLFFKYGKYNENLKIVSDWEKWIIFFINKCSFKHVNIICSNFELGGMSSKNNLQEEERNIVLKKYISTKQIRKINNRKKYNFFEKIFSVKNFNNENCSSKKNKIITLFGFKIIIK